MDCVIGLSFLSFSLSLEVVLGESWRLDEFVDEMCETLLGDALSLGRCVHECLL